MLRKLSFVVGVFVLAAFVHAAPVATAQDEAPTYPVSGIVADDTGAPIAGAYVYGYTEGGSDRMGSGDKAITAADGTFTLKLPAGKGYLNANHDKFRQGASLEIVVDGNESGLRLVLPLPPPRTAIVEGTVLGPDGDPVAGAQVTIGQGCCYLYEGMEKSASPPAPTPPTASGGGSSGSAGAASSDAPMTRPAIWYDGDHQSATTGPDGKYRFETYPGPRQVTAYAEGYAQVTRTVEAKENETVAADLKLEKVPPADALVRVRVVDARTGLPLQGAGVNVQNLEWTHYAYGTTGADGRAEATTLPGWVTINVHYYGWNDVAVADSDVAVDSIMRPGGAPGKQYYAYVKTLRVASGDTQHDVQLEPKPDPTVVLTGYVVDPDAKAGVPGAQVSVWNQDTGDWGSATTDATGSYKLLVRPGHYTMNAWAQDHLPGATMFVIADGEAAKRVDVEAPAGQQKHAPCVDACPRPLPATAEAKDADGGAAVATSAATLQDEAASRTFATSDAPQAPGGADVTRGAAYQGSGGGLPPYSAATADQRAGSPQVNVPGPGVAAALAVLGALALARRARRT